MAVVNSGIIPAAAADTSTPTIWTLAARALSDLITAAGIPKTTDTGQADFTTPVGATPANNTYPFYEIRKFNDALQATAPIFIKIEYGNSQFPTNNSGNVFSTRWTFGTGSNGAGTLTGATQLMANTVMAVNSGSVLFASSVGGSFLSIIPGWASQFNTNNAAAPGFISIERLKDVNGADTADGFCVVGNTGSGSAGSRTCHTYRTATGTWYPTTAVTAICAFPSVGAQATYGGNMGFFPAYSNLGGVAGYAQLGVIYFIKADMPNAADSIIPVTLVVQNRSTKYWCFVTSLQHGGINGNAVNYGVGVRME